MVDCPDLSFLTLIETMAKRCEWLEAALAAGPCNGVTQTG